MELVINMLMFGGGLAVAVHTLLLANFTTACPWYFKPVLILCVPGGVLMCWGAVYNPGIGMYAASVTILPLITVQIIAWAHGAEVSTHLKEKADEKVRQSQYAFNRLKRDLMDPTEDLQEILTESGKRELERTK